MPRANDQLLLCLAAGLHEAEEDAAALDLQVAANQTVDRYLERGELLVVGRQRERSREGSDRRRPLHP